MKHLIFSLLFLTASFTPVFSQKRFMVCGDTKVLIVDYTASKDSTPEIIWDWDAEKVPGLDAKKFKTVDDCKSISGKRFLVSASSGAIAMIGQDKKVLFTADVPNAHSIELLPGGFIAAAASTSAKGNAIMLFHPQKGNLPLYRDSLYSAHGLVWMQDEQLLYALGYHVLRAYKLISGNKPALQKVREWKIAGEGGHDLQPAPDGNLFVTDERDVWKFDHKKGTFSHIPGVLTGVKNVKSLGLDAGGQYIYTLPEESWWT
ncbi:MAG: hypothetical protein INR69_22465, partial [Mucilaginibacter polytrichastri]|nr:hypothetical protein [Mucilaginibacter polytrichastri]